MYCDNFEIVEHSSSISTYKSCLHNTFYFICIANRALKPNVNLRHFICWLFNFSAHKFNLNNENIHWILPQAYLCEGSYILLEYARTAMFLWMFIEGLYLHTVVTVTVFQGRFPHYFYISLGWGVPIVMTVSYSHYLRIYLMKIISNNLCTLQAIWAAYTAVQKSNQKCWYGYNLTPYYWILEGPRMTVVIVSNNSNQISAL